MRQPAKNILKPVVPSIAKASQPCRSPFPPEAQAIIEIEIASGRFNTEADVIVEALRQLHSDVPHVPDEWLMEARAQADRGEGRELTEEVWQEIRKRAMDGARLGTPVRDEIKY